jgi:hypothetical protein
MSHQELRALTTIADYYCVLPALSSSIDMMLLRSPDLVGQIQVYPAAFLEIATQLHHAGLFREALILLLGPWRRPLYQH